ncbi:hypothetical protein ALON55S_07349 [Alishewanella longhuensis]
MTILTLLFATHLFIRQLQKHEAVNRQKWQKLGKTNQGRNFAGSNRELACDGGEL